MGKLIQELKRNPVPMIVLAFTIAYFGMHTILWLAGIPMKDLTMQAMGVK